MKKLEVRSEKESKKRRNNLIIGIIIVALMVFSSLGYVIVERTTGSETGNEYNGYEFVKVSSGTYGGWQTILKSFSDKKLVTSYLPQDVLNYSGTGADLFYFSGRTMYIIVSSQSDIQASYDFLYNLNGVVSRMQFACSYDNENSSFCQTSNFPLKSCDDTSYSTTVVKIDLNSTTTDYKINKSCYTLSGQEGKGSDFVKMTDNLIFKLFGVIT
jgi:hypothetical protein